MSTPRDDRRKKRLERFRESTRERVWRINLSWIQYEQGQGDAAASAEILRELHTLKGEASLMGFSAASEVAHAIEDAVQASRDSGVVHGDLGDRVLEGLDMLAALIAVDPSDLTTEIQQRIDSLRQLGGPGSGDGARAAEPAADPGESAKLAPAPVGYAVRVTRRQLDQVRDIIGELLLTRTRLTSTATSLRRHRDNGAADPGRDIRDALGEIETSLRDDVLRMGNLVTALEDITRELRMVPIGVLFEQFPRAARDLARELGKKVQVAYEGQALELDREVLEALSEPLLHLVRNAVDHGIEPGEHRQRAGKPEVGTLRLSARMVGTMLEVQVADDGAGIDRDRVRRLAIERELIDEAAGPLNDEEVLRCLIAPGMTTRTAVTQVSGRGVGLDIVHQTLRSLGGSLTLSTAPGEGTRFGLSVPISVAISSVVLFRVGDGRYALPSGSVVALVEKSTVRHVDSISGRSVHFGGEVMPLLELPALLGEPPGEHNADRAERLMITGTGTRLVALGGAREHIQRDVVLKSAGKLLSQRRLISAGVALEDGSVALVLSPPSILGAARAQVVDRARATAAAAFAGSKATVLVADDSPIVLDLIAETLRSYGLVVIEASDGEQAIQLLAEHPEIDMLVTDVEMPRLDGLQLIARLRQDQRRRIPAIVVSTRGSDDDKKAAMRVGADAYLVKSDFTRDSLWSLVQRFVE